MALNNGRLLFDTMLFATVDGQNLRRWYVVGQGGLALISGVKGSQHDTNIFFGGNHERWVWGNYHKLTQDELDLQYMRFYCLDNRLSSLF